MLTHDELHDPRSDVARLFNQAKELVKDNHRLRANLSNSYHVSALHTANYRRALSRILEYLHERLVDLDEPELRQLAEVASDALNLTAVDGPEDSFGTPHDELTPHVPGDGSTHREVAPKPRWTLIALRVDSPTWTIGRDALLPYTEPVNDDAAIVTIGAARRFRLEDGTGGFCDDHHDCWAMSARDGTQFHIAITHPVTRP